MTERTEYCYKSTLKQGYGLPDSWITRLGDPDKMVPNPHYKTGSISYLYLRSRVEAFIEEHQEQYRILLERRSRQRQASKSAAARRASDLVKWAESVTIQVGNLPATLDELYDLAEVSFYTRLPEWRSDDVFYRAPGAIVAHVRHGHSNYEGLLGSIEGKPGCAEAYQIIKDRVNRLIDETLKKIYPEDW